MRYPERATLLARAALPAAIFVLLAAPAPAQPEGDSSRPTLGRAECPGCYTWKPLRIGAGGWLTGLDLSPDGATRLVRTDTYGAYVWDTSEWRQVVTAASLPSADVGVEKNAGVYEIRVAPSQVSRLYMAYRGYVYRSDDQGRSWTRTAFARVTMDPNDSYRTLGEKMAVDPANPDVVYVGTPRNGLWVTDNGGATWTAISAVPAGLQASNGWPGITGIAIDPASRRIGARSRLVYASSWGNGVWRSSDGGASWARLAGGPASVGHALVARDSALYATAGDGSAVWRFSRGAWTNVTPPWGQYWHAVLADPYDANRVLAATDGGYLTQSYDRGATWSEIAWSASRNASDVPWLAWTNESYMSNGDMAFDPLVPDQLWFAQGIGVWTASVPRQASSVAWSSRSVGIEQLVANAIAAPPGGRPVVASWDRPLFYSANSDTFPAQHGPNNAHSIVMGFQVDYAAGTPSFLAAVADWWGVEESGYSTDGGQTWTRFPALPAWWPSAPGLGTLAVSTPDNIVWVASNGKAPYATTDRGQSWQKLSLPGVADSTAGWSGLHSAYYLNRHVLAADRVTPGTFYLYHTPNGLYRSTNGGAAWNLVRSGEIAPYSGYNAKLEAVPGRAGHLFFTSGQQSGTSPSGAFMRSTDGGATWSAVPNVLEVYAFGFGKEAPGGSYPSLYVVGWVGGVYGVWRSDNQAQSWTQIGDYPLGSLDEVKAVEGDKNVYGTVYLGFAGSGYAYGGIN